MSAEMSHSPMHGVQALTIVVPVYNEVPCIPRLVERLDEFLAAADCDVRVLLVNDGSTDQSLAFIQAACQKRPRYAYISLADNSGLSAALRAGIDHAQTPWVGYIDADLQTSPMDFLKLLPHCGPFDLVTGVRMKRKDTVVKRISSIVANTVRQRILKDGMKDTCCPLKIGRTLMLRSVPFFTGAHRFLPILVQMNGGRVYQTPVSHYPRIAGKAKYHLGNRLIGPLVGLLVVSWLQRNKARYHVEGSYVG
jgi:glycosyltransferase involved in cell wall biosynthesis